MSSLTRYGFALFLAVYGIYQMSNGRLLVGLLAIAVGAGFALLGRRR
jgi:hypothetical protein